MFIHDARERLLESRFSLLSDSMQVVEFNQPLLELDLKTVEEFLLELFQETILPMYQILLINLVVWERLVAREKLSHGNSSRYVHQAAELDSGTFLVL